MIGVNIARPKWGYRLVSVCTIIGILTLIAGNVALLSAGRQGVVGYMDFPNSIGANTTYTKVAASFTGAPFDFNATIMMLPFFAIFVYPWVFAGPAVIVRAERRKPNAEMERPNSCVHRLPARDR